MPDSTHALEAHTGSGFYVGKDGHILTNHHVIEDCGRIEVQLGGVRKDVKLVASDSSNDIALLWDASPATSVAVFRDGKLRAGSDVLILGYPLYGALSREAIVTTGTVSALAGMMNNAATFQLSAPTQPGNSGGPVLDANGALIGMMYGMLDSTKGTKLSGQVPQNVNFAIHGAVIRTFLDAHGVAYTSRPPGAARDRADVVEEARRYTVLIRCYAEDESTKRFANEVLFQVFDHEAPGWRAITMSDYETWLKSQSSAYREQLHSSRDPYVWAESLNDFMKSRQRKPPTPDSPGPTNRSAIADPPLNKMPAEQQIDPKSSQPSQTDRSLSELSKDLDKKLQELKAMSSGSSQQASSSSAPRKADANLRKPNPIIRSAPDEKSTFRGPSASQYLSRVQARIRSMWNAPPIDASGKPLTVVMRFRIERDGRISGLMVEQSSGNEYYDLSAHRAIQSAVPLPPFPSDITEPYLDAHYTFAVGASAR
jgi:TonB family protein